MILEDEMLKNDELVEIKELEIASLTGCC